MFTGVGATIEALHNNSTVRAVGEIAMKSAIPTYQFESPALRAFETWSKIEFRSLIEFKIIFMSFYLTFFIRS